MQLTVYSREGCGLCEELLEALTPLAAARGLELRVLDVDADALLKRRYGLRVPVLTLEDEWICNGRLDVDALERGLAGAKRALARREAAARLL